MRYSCCMIWKNSELTSDEELIIFSIQILSLTPIHEFLPSEKGNKKNFIKERLSGKTGEQKAYSQSNNPIGMMKK